jgi:hypothetical protein
MWRCRRVTSTAALVAAAALSVLAGPAAAGSPALTRTYTDRIGDNTGGADIGDTTVSFSGGVLTFRITIANRSTWTAGEVVQLFLNTDGNQVNNDVGSEYVIVTGTDASGAVLSQLGLYNLAAGGYQLVTVPSFGGSFANGVIEAHVSLADLNAVPVIDVSVFSRVGGTADPTDTAPDNRGWFSPSFDTRDADSDGVADNQDLCPSEPAGNFDPNQNGCAGPYERVSAPRPAISAVPVRGGLRFQEAALVFIDRGARVVVKARGRTQTSIKGARPLVLRIVVGRTLAYGSLITVSITEANEIGWYGQYRVTPRGLKLVSRKCIAPGRTSPVSCSSVDPGQ